MRAYVFLLWGVSIANSCSYKPGGPHHSGLGDRDGGSPALRMRPPAGAHGTGPRRRIRGVVVTRHRRARSGELRERELVALRSSARATDTGAALTICGRDSQSRSPRRTSCVATPALVRESRRCAPTQCGRRASSRVAGGGTGWTVRGPAGAARAIPARRVDRRGRRGTTQGCSAGPAIPRSEHGAGSEAGGVGLTCSEVQCDMSREQTVVNK